MSNNINNCPICETSVNASDINCPTCGWELSPVLGSDKNSITAYQQKLQQHKAQWRSNSLPIAKEPPMLERDPFETFDEWEERLTTSSYQIGEIELIKSGYDIETGYFPVKWHTKQEWFQQFLEKQAIIILKLHLKLARDYARDLYNTSQIWPVLVSLKIVNRNIQIKQLTLVINNKEHNLDSRVYFECPPPEQIIGSFFIDNNDGTVTDSRTGLMWARFCTGEQWNEEEKQCTGTYSYYELNKAFDFIKKLNSNGGFANHNDWRIPNEDELKTIVKPDSIPSIDREVFPSDTIYHLFAYSSEYSKNKTFWTHQFNEAFDGGNISTYSTLAIKPVRQAI